MQGHRSEQYVQLVCFDSDTTAGCAGLVYKCPLHAQDQDASCSWEAGV